MDVKEILDVSSSLVKFIVPIGTFLFGLFITSNVAMNENKEKLARILKNVFGFIICTILIYMFLVVSLGNIISEIDFSKISKKEADNLILISLVLLLYSVFYAVVLLPLWARNKKYYEIELEHVPGIKKSYKVINRITNQNTDSIIYKDKKGYHYEEDVQAIKERESRITLKPKMESLFNINEEFKELTRNAKDKLRIMFYVFFVLVSAYLIYTCIALIVSIFKITEGPIFFILLMAGLPSLIILYDVIVAIGIYKFWFGKSKIEYVKHTNASDKIDT